MSKRYKIIKSDLCIAGKIYKEGAIVNFMDESLKNFFEPVPEEKVKEEPKPLPIIPVNPEITSIKSQEVTPAAVEPIPIPESSMNLEQSIPVPEVDINIPKKGRSKKAAEAI